MTLVRLWEVADVATGRRVSLHRTYMAALAAEAAPQYRARMRTIPRLLRWSLAPIIRRLP